MKIHKLLLVFLFFDVSFQMCSAASEVIRFDHGRASLNAKWQWALDAGKKQHQKGEFWVGYFFEKPDDESHPGHFSNEPGQTLSEIVSGDSLANPHNVAILFRIKREKDRSQIAKIELLNLSSSFDRDSLPLFWLDSVEATESVAFLGNFFKNTSVPDLKEKLVAAIGIHPPLREVFAFLKGVIEGKSADDLREEAVFWLALQKTPEALALLKQLVQHDPSHTIRKKAVFGIYLVNQDASVEILIDLVRHEKDVAVRREAIFWLGQIAEKNAADFLEEIAFDDEQLDIQKQAIFALSQMPADESIPRLIKVVKTHPSQKIRKNAIFWLGQTEDKRALELLCELARGKK